MTRKQLKVIMITLLTLIIMSVAIYANYNMSVQEGSTAEKKAMKKVDLISQTFEKNYAELEVVNISEDRYSYQINVPYGDDEIYIKSEREMEIVKNEDSIYEIQIPLYEGDHLVEVQYDDIPVVEHTEGTNYGPHDEYAWDIQYYEVLYDMWPGPIFYDLETIYHVIPTELNSAFDIEYADIYLENIVYAKYIIRLPINMELEEGLKINIYTIGEEL